MLVILISLFLILVYSALFLHYRRIWLAAPRIEPPEPDPELTLTVIIPFRNEEHHLPALLEALKKQEYDQDKVEYLFVDDHSGDRSVKIIGSALSQIPRARIIHQTAGRSGKKEALKQGVTQARGTLILTTDADCVQPPGWLKMMAWIYQHKKPVFISGPVRIYPVQHFFERFQALEFSALTGTGGASFINGSPLMCSGANLAFEKELFLEAYPFMHPDVPSGDDMFLMLYAKKNYPGRLEFLRHPAATVDTLPVKDLYGFLKQRTRWTSKSLLYRDIPLVSLSILIFLVNGWILFLTGAGFIHRPLWIVLFFYLLMKSLSDYFFLKEICLFYKQSGLLKIFIPSQLIYPFYNVIVAVSGLFSGRKNTGR